jgi:hypothetical protein
MNDTATSSIESNVHAGILSMSNLLAATVALPSKDINKCPATMFAINRIDSVIGRMTFLVISISTIKFISGVGVPNGTRCTIMDLTSFLKDKRLIDNQAGIVTRITGTACLVIEKVWG